MYVAAPDPATAGVLEVPQISKTATMLTIGEITVPIQPAVNEALVPSILFYDVPVTRAPSELSWICAL